MIPSDHSAITAKFNWLVRPKDEENEEMYLNTNRNNKEKFLRMTSGNRLNQAIQKGTIQEKYTNWERELENIVNECFLKKRKKQRLRTPIIRKMMSRRRCVLKEIAKTEEEAKRGQLRAECNDLEEKIRTERWRLVNQGIIEEIDKIDEAKEVA